MIISNETIAGKIQNFILPEYFLILWLLLLFGFIFYKIYLKKISAKRKNNLNQRFKLTAQILFVTTFFSILNWILVVELNLALKLTPLGVKGYTLGLVALLFLSAMAFIKSAQIFAYLYLFFKNISVGIPRLIANLFTFVLSVCVGIYLFSEVFSINLTTMVATSAVFSIVLGLALQDTLGNLFSGVALQIGNPFSIGDWIEVQSGSSKWIGQVQEVTWRSTFLTSFSNEWTMIPNKIMAQSQILIYSYNLKQVRHSLTYRIAFGSDFEKVKKLLMDTVLENSDVVKEFLPKVLLIESTESWVTVKVFYSIENFEKKYSIADALLTSTLNKLEASGIKLAGDRVSINS